MRSLFLSYVLVETFHETIPQDRFPGYIVFDQPAVKLSQKGRRSGGVLCLIRKELKRYVRKPDASFQNIILLTIDKALLNVHKDILYVCAYVPPEGSPFYAYFDIHNGIDNLEDCISECILTIGDVFIMLSGDLNSRTSNVSQNYLSTDDVQQHRSE